MIKMLLARVDHLVANFKSEFLALHHVLENWTDKSPTGGVESKSQPLLLEIVLLLRQFQASAHAHCPGELKHLSVITSKSIYFRRNNEYHNL